MARTKKASEVEEPMVDFDVHVVTSEDEGLSPADAPYDVNMSVTHGQGLLSSRTGLGEAWIYTKEQQAEAKEIPTEHIIRAFADMLSTHNGRKVLDVELVIQSVAK